MQYMVAVGPAQHWMVEYVPHLQPTLMEDNTARLINVPDWFHLDFARVPLSRSLLLI